MITRETEKDIVSDLRDFYINEIQEYFDRFPSIQKACDSLMISFMPISNLNNWSFRKLQIYYDRITNSGYEKRKEIVKWNVGKPKKYNLDEVCSLVEKYINEDYPRYKIHEKVGFGSHRNMIKYLQRNNIDTKKLLITKDQKS